MNLEINAIANVITALALLVGAYATLKHKPFKKLQDIDAAVNGKAPGEQSMVSQVDDLHKEIPPAVPAVPTNGVLIALVRELVEDKRAREAARGAHE